MKVANGFESALGLEPTAPNSPTTTPAPSSPAQSHSLLRFGRKQKNIMSVVLAASDPGDKNIWEEYSPDHAVYPSLLSLPSFYSITIGLTNLDMIQRENSKQVH